MSRNQTTTLPHPDPPAANVPKKNPLPCYVILVHGVNDVGEAYEAQEKGICWGLAERLDRDHDLQPAAYSAPRRSDTSRSGIRQANDPSEQVVQEPEKRYYRRYPTQDSYTPVIPFYWGFREEDARIRSDRNLNGAWHGELLDRDGNRLDKDGTKGGGAFVNASNCLPHMWAPGWKPPIPGMNTFASLNDKTHPLIKATCYRRYQVLAALRLAMLIRIIRKRHPKAAVNIVAHSMGCLVSLLAQAYLMDEEGGKPADALVLNNPPYSFKENLLDGHLFQDINQTSRARIETFQKIVKAFHARRATSPAWESGASATLGRGLAGQRWSPAKGRRRHPATGDEVEFQERDNRGKIYLYFTPHDKTVALRNTQGIGWCGVPDSYTDEWKDARGEKVKMTWTRLLAQLSASGFRQRLFMLRERGGTTYRVGLPPGHVSLQEEGESYLTLMDRGKAKGLPDHTLRYINGEPLDPPVHFDPGPDVLPLSPIDAAVALTNNGTCRFWDEVDDPRPVNERKAIIHSDQYEPIRWKLNDGKPKGQQVPAIIDMYTPTNEQGVPTGKLMISRNETPDETRHRLQNYGTSENSHHSSIVSNPWHSQSVTAYDLALGRPIPWTEKEKKFYDYLCEAADWRVKACNSGAPPKIDNKLDPLTASGFFEKEDPQNKSLIVATAWYYTKGNLPIQVDQAKPPDQLLLIHFETTGKRASDLRST